MREPLFLKPVFQEKIWGGKKLAEEYDYQLSSDKIGECWGISAHPHGVSTVENGKYAGEKLDKVWKEAPELFGNPKTEVFPLLVKILDAEDDLSVQVHPDDAYGKTHAGELGKTECWYILDAEPGSEIIYGHHAKTKEELTEMIHDKKWSQLLRHIPVKKGDFYYVPSGTIHGIGKGIMILETQQSSDTTYRVYDYDRKDSEGNLRPLHIQESIDVTTVPHVDPKLNIVTENYGKSSVTDYVTTPFFAVELWEIIGRHTFHQKAPYTLCTVIEGAGELEILNENGLGEQTYNLEKGQHFILPNEVKNWRITGELKLISSIPGESVR